MSFTCACEFIFIKIKRNDRMVDGMNYGKEKVKMSRKNRINEREKQNKKNVTL